LSSINHLIFIELVKSINEVRGTVTGVEKMLETINFHDFEQRFERNLKKIDVLARNGPNKENFTPY
jgi:hypothetical protein